MLKSLAIAYSAPILSAIIGTGLAQTAIINHETSISLALYIGSIAAAIASTATVMGLIIGLKRDAKESKEIAEANTKTLDEHGEQIVAILAAVEPLKRHDAEIMQRINGLKCEQGHGHNECKEQSDQVDPRGGSWT